MCFSDRMCKCSDFIGKTFVVILFVSSERFLSVAGLMAITYETLNNQSVFSLLPIYMWQSYHASIPVRCTIISTILYSAYLIRFLIHELDYIR